MSRTMMRLRRLQVLAGLMLILSLLMLGGGTAFAAPTFDNNGFQNKWERADKPVADNTANPQRSWLWGPESFEPPSGTTEPYAQTPGGSRQVLYFDKARMEINNPSTGLVTNGLLVRELISGRLATGDTTFTQRLPADDIPVAGDPTNNVGPTYASFAKVASLNGDNPASSRTGMAVNDTISQDGTLGTDNTLGAMAKYVYFDSSLKHNIPDVFWKFLNQTGTIYQNGQLVSNQPVLGDNPAAPWVDATGLPITEAYWAKVTLAGKQVDVLIQAFERRVLTYTPSNPAAFQVEMGNVGRHYYNWRYNSKYDIVASTPTCSTLPANVNGAFAWIQCGPAGMDVVVEGVGMQANEAVNVNYTRGDGTTNQYTTIAHPDGVTLLAIDTAANSPQGMWTFNFKGQISGKQETAYFFLQPAVSQPTVIVYPTTSSLSQDITIAIVGFGSKERVGVGFLSPAPDAPVLAVPIDLSQGGGYTGLFKIRVIYPQQYQTPGTWTVIVTNADQSHKAITSFEVTK